MRRDAVRPATLHCLNRPVLSFRHVNRRGAPDFDPGLQRHHLLPRQLLGRRCFDRMFADLSVEKIGFDDFRRNGLLLPASERAVRRLGLPLHRGPHRRYNEVVIERVGQIERNWSADKNYGSKLAAVDAAMRLTLLQAALRKKLLDPRFGPGALHRRDPLGVGFDFTELDSMADRLWPATDLS